MTRRSRILRAGWASAALGAWVLLLASCSGSVERRSGTEPGAAGCTHGGRHFDVGDSFPAGDGCNTCSCTEEGVACTEMGCGVGGSVGTGGTGGTGTCVYSGSVYYPGESFPAGDGCNSCTCSEDGSVSCTRLACKGCFYNGSMYEPGQGFPAGDGCNGCTCGEDGSVFCTQAYCLTCTYEGQTYAAGASFPALDGCNTCTCYEGGAVGCTTMACLPCDPEAEWYREYVATSASQCALIDYVCPENTTYFGNDCGCGCQQDRSCPEWFDCMDPAVCDPVAIKQKCPYSGIAY